VVSIGLAAAYPGHAQGWGNIKGKVEWKIPVIPAPVNLVANVPAANIPPCVKGGVVLSDESIIDKQTKGVANVMVWIASLNDAGLSERKPKQIRVHPDLKAVPKDKVVIDQPCCLFTPRVLMLREGQILEIRNSAAFNHNFHLSASSEVNGSRNINIPPGGKEEWQLKAEKWAMSIQCDIHGWMKGKIVVLNHPYFALTKSDGTFEIKNAPAGKFLIFLSHETPGWVHKGGSKGQEIQIKAGETLDLGKFAMP
jgi:plastocyanin